MDYKKAYEETFEQLFIATSQLSKSEVAEEKTYLVLCTQSQVIAEIYRNLDKVTGERKDKAEAMLKRLILVYNHIGKVYMDELIARKRNIALDKALLEAADEIKQLENQIETLNKIDRL